MAILTPQVIATAIKNYNDGKIILMPRGDYSAVRVFPKGLTFPVGCKFGDRTKFGDYTKFGCECEFALLTQFGQHNVIGANAVIGSAASFGANCYISRYANIGTRAVIGSDSTIEGPAWVGHTARFGSNCDIGRDARYDVTLGSHCTIGQGSTITDKLVAGERLRFEGDNKIKVTQPGYMVAPKVFVIKQYSASKTAVLPTAMLAFNGGGSEGRTTYFFNTTAGVIVRSGCFCGTLKQFRARVKRDCRSPKSVKRLQYLGFANIVCVTWGYDDQVE